VDNVITALTSNTMIAPSYWIDPQDRQWTTWLTVQYPETQIKSLLDLKSIPLRSADRLNPTQLDMVGRITRHTVANGSGSLPIAPHNRRFSCGRSARTWVELRSAIDRMIPEIKATAGVRVDPAVAWCKAWRGVVSQLRFRVDAFAGTALPDSGGAIPFPFCCLCLILLAVPPGLTGVLITLYLTGTTLNVMSLMGVVMLGGIAVADSILIVEFAPSS